MNRHLTRLISLIFSILIALTSTPARADYRLSAHCQGNSWSTCFILFDGEIEEGLHEHMSEVLEEYDYPTIFVNSLGGDLGEALRVGRLIRQQNRDTAIGLLKNAPIDPLEYVSAPNQTLGSCESACAYMFMGGIKRHLLWNPSSQRTGLGFHRFYLKNGTLSSDFAQQASAVIVAYLVEMGIDARLFLAASKEGADSMYYVSESEARQYSIIKPEGFGPVFLEPYGVGIVAASRRQDLPEALRPHDHTSQITFYCEGGAPRILLTSLWLGVADDFNEAAERNDPTVLSIGVPYAGGGKPLPTSWVHASENNQKTTLIVKFPNEQRHVLLKELEKEEFWINVFFGNAFGGDFGVNLELNQMDRAMIKSALSLCIR